MRRYVIPAVLSLLLVTSGCLGAVMGDGPLEFTASEGTVDDAALEETDYELVEQRSVELNRTVELEGIERDVHATNHVATYARSMELPGGETEQAAFFAVATTPQASVGGQAMNPVGQMSERKLVAELTERSDEFGDLEEVDSRTTTVLGQSTEVVKYETTVQVEGMEVDAFVHVTRVEHGDDYVVAVGAYPKQFDDEEDAFFTLLENVEH